MQKEIRTVINACTSTAGKKALTVKAALKPTPMPLRAFELVGLDLVTLTKSCTGKRYLIVAQDYYTQWPEIQAVEQKTTRNVAKFVSDFVSRYGCPLEIVTDRGKEFLGPVNEMLTRCRVIHRTTSAYRPQANGLVEQMNRYIVRSLSAALEGRDLDTWEEGLTDFLASYRGFRHASTGYSPHELVMRRPMRLPWKFHALPRHVLPNTLTQQRWNSIWCVCWQVWPRCRARPKNRC